MIPRALLLTGAVAATLLTGCGGGSSGGAAAPPPATPTSTGPAAAPPTTAPATVTASPTGTVTATASPPKPAAGGPCATASLSLSLGQSQGAAGTSYQPLILTNTGSSSCTLVGYPGVSYTTAGGSQLGPPAARDGGPVHRVTLAAGGKASALLRQPDAGNFPASGCHARQAARLRVYPPNQHTSLTVADSVQVCTTSAGRAGIGAMQAGTDPH